MASSSKRPNSSSMPRPVPTPVPPPDGEAKIAVARQKLKEAETLLLSADRILASIAASPGVSTSEIYKTAVYRNWTASKVRTKIGAFLGA